MINKDKDYIVSNCSIHWGDLMGGKQAEFREQFIRKADIRRSRLILALDEPLLKQMRNVTQTTNHLLAAMKIHREYLDDDWKIALADLRSSSLFPGPIISDAKLADIDRTNAMKARSHFNHGFDAITCHAFPGQKAVEAVVKVANEMNKGVFLLTAMTSEGHCFDTKIIERFSAMARELDVAGVIAPGNQYEVLRRVRRAVGPELLILSPGIGIQGGDAEKAFIAGADFAIVGGQILRAGNPGEVAGGIRKVINRALETKVDTSVREQKEEPLARYDELFSILVDKEVMRFGTFTLKSGRPSIYFFNAGRIDDGKSISAVAEAYADTIHENKLHEQFDVLFGPAYKGIPIATYVTQALWTKYGINMRAVYDRKEAKDHGEVASGKSMDKEFVGEIRKGDRILILDDVITTGGTKHDAVGKLDSLNLDLKINGLLILFDREETDLDGKDPLKELEGKGIKTWVVLKARDVFEYMKGKEFVGKVLITDELHREFQKHQGEFGREVKNTGQ
jgi:orotate phosphoribosyltransferase